MATAKNPQDKVAHWWSVDSASLFIVGGARSVRFSDFKVTLDLTDPLHEEVNRVLETHRSRDMEYHRILTGQNDKAAQQKMMAKVQSMLYPSSEGDGHDDVAKVSGILKLAALFTDAELKEFGMERNNPDTAQLTLEASQTKTIEGV